MAGEKMSKAIVHRFRQGYVDLRAGNVFPARVARETRRAEQWNERISQFSGDELQAIINEAWYNLSVHAPEDLHQQYLEARVELAENDKRKAEKLSRIQAAQAKVAIRDPADTARRLSTTSHEQDMPITHETSTSSGLGALATRLVRRSR